MSLSRRRLGALTGLAGLGVLAGCASTNPVAGPASAASTAAGTTTGTPGAARSLVVGSQQYYSNEIIAELYAQVLEKAGWTVTRQYQIGQREVYLPELESGAIDLIPEYGGNLLQYYDKQSKATDAAQVQAALASVLPDGLRVLEPAQASDQDSYTVTAAFADQHQLTQIGDLARVKEPLKIAANSEFATRPYGPEGVKAAYGVDITVVPVEDSGGPLTVKALRDGDVQVADIYTADPVIVTDKLVVLEDPKALILPQRVTPLVSGTVDDAAAQAIGSVNQRLSAEELRTLNAQSVTEKRRSADIAREWLTAQGLV